MQKNHQKRSKKHKETLKKSSILNELGKNKKTDSQNESVFYVTVFFCILFGLFLECFFVCVEHGLFEEFSRFGVDGMHYVFVISVGSFS